MRHGTPTCYVNHGCRRPECRAAALRRMKAYTVRREAAGGSLTVPMFRASRRIQALQRMGWPVSLIAEKAGLASPRSLYSLQRRKRMHLTTFSRLEEVYERLAMVPGPSDIARGVARARGFPPPLAWVDIDDPTETPTGVLQ